MRSSLSCVPSGASRLESCIMSSSTKEMGSQEPSNSKEGPYGELDAYAETKRHYTQQSCI